jgi:hypothetical protein
MSKEAMKLELNNLISEFSMENSSFAKRVDDIFKEALAEQPAQPQQEPQTSVQERTEFEQFWVDELGEADELTYGKLGYAIRRVDVAWEAWKAGKISANQQTIVGRKVWIDWKAQALELRELVRLNGIKIAELESEQPAQQQEPVALGYMNAGHVHEMQQGRLPYGYVYPKGGTGAGVAVYTSPPARKPLTDEQIAAMDGADPARGSLNLVGG